MEKEKLLDFCEERHISYLDIKDDDFIPPYKNLASKYKYKIYNQQGLDSCICISICSLIEYMHQKQTGEFVEYSKLYLFKNSKDLRHKDVLESLVKDGICEQWKFRYERGNFDKDVPENIENLKINMTVLLCSSFYVETVKYVIGVLDRPVVLGIKLTRTFREFTSKNSLYSIQPNDNFIENHSMLIVGYSDQDRVFIVQNSWGEEFGNKGFCYIPYHCINAHTITSLYTFDNI